MDRAKNLGVYLFLAVAFVALFCSVRSSTGADSIADGMLPPEEVKPAVDFNLPNAQTGQMVDLIAQSKQMPVVFSFWATWCGPCRMELPHLQKLAQTYHGRAAFYGVNSNDSPADIRKFIAENQMTLPMLSDVKQDAATKYGIQSIPTLYVVDTQGKVRATFNGFDPDIDSKMTHILDTLLAERQ